MKVRPWPEVLELLPPLSQQEQDALQRSLKQHQDSYEPILVLPDGRIIDGHHRWELSKHKHPTRVVDLPEDEAFDLALELNLARRQMSREQAHNIAQELRKRGKTQQETADLLGKARRTIDEWEGTNVKNDNGSGDITIPDRRLKIPIKERSKILVRTQNGETQEHIAADYKVSWRAIGKIVKAETKRESEREAWQLLSSQTVAENGIRIGDFRNLQQGIADDSINMIFTDPPYHSVDDYGDLAKMAARVLVPGGLCLAYSGHAHLPEVLSAMTKHLDYMWIGAITHTGGNLRFRKYKIRNEWKPILMFGKPPLTVGWDWFSDITSGGKEKDQHPWQQAELEAVHYLFHLCPKGGTVLDPFCGSGTTLAAAKSLELSYIGFEIDETTAKKASERLISQ